MARTINDIKQQMVEQYTTDAQVKAKYGVISGNVVLSALSIENLIFYVVATAIWLLEKIFDTGRSDINAQLVANVPHTPAWYRGMVLGFMYQGDSVAKHCAIREDVYPIQIKVAGDSNGMPVKITDTAKVGALVTYINSQKDAGIHFELVNATPDAILLDVTVYTLGTPPESSNTSAIDGWKQSIKSAVDNYLKELEIGGALTVAGVTNAINSVDGVGISHINQLATRYESNNPIVIETQAVSYSGYWNIDTANINITFARWTGTII